MSVERLERVLWRLRKRAVDKDNPTEKELRVAIMHECGTDPLTIKNNKRALRELGWLKKGPPNYWHLTGGDLTGD